MAVFAGGKTLLNMNDCVFDHPNELAAIQAKVGKVDVLLSQFSYANWVGNPGDHASHREHAERKRQEIREQIERFKPATFVPFASFIYFAHVENFFMNRAVNRIRDVYEFATVELKAPTAVLYPGDLWTVGAPRDSSESLLRYELDFDRANRAPAETTPSIPLAKLQQAAHTFLKKSSYRNTRLLLKALSPSVVRLRDLGIDVELSYRHGIVEVNGKQADIILSSDSLLYCLNHDWGGECLAINGRYEIPAGANPQWFFWTFRVPAHNRAGNSLNLRFLASQMVKRARRAMATWSSTAES
jgi:hypothetical protein